MDFVDHWPAVWNLEMGKNECEQESVDSPQVFYYSYYLEFIRESLQKRLWNYASIVLT